MTVMTTERPTTVAPAPIAATVRQGVGALSLSAMTPAEVWGFCERLADTPLLPDAYRRNASSILWALEYGRALNLDVVTTITTIHVIKGKPSQSADLMLSRTRAAGHRVRVQPGEGSCTVSIWRSDDPEFENRVTWTYDDAVTANLCEMRNNRPYSRSQKGEPQAWEKYPRAMLRARAISECVRQACPEVLHGAIYTPEELGAVIDQDGNPLDVQPQLQRQAPGQDAWATATPAPVQHATPPPQKGGEQAERPANRRQERPAAPSRDYLADAMAANGEEAYNAVLAAARAAGAPGPYLSMLEDIGEAHRAPDVAAVRKLHAALQERGAPREHLARIAEIGGRKPGAKQQQRPPAEQRQAAEDGYDPATGDGIEPPIYTGPAGQQPPASAAGRSPAEAAEERLRIAASRARLTTVDQDFYAVYGLPIGEATAQQLNAFADRIEAAGGQQ